MRIYLTILCLLRSICAGVCLLWTSPDHYRGARIAIGSDGLLYALCSVGFVLVLAMLESDATAELGPRMTDDEFFEALNLEHPGLSAAKDALERGHRQKAKQALAHYFRTRETPVWSYRERQPTNRDQLLRTVKPVMDRVFRVSGVTHRFGAGNDIDWFHNATGGDSGVVFNREWTWQLNRHSHWRILASAYRATGDEMYAREFVDQVDSWIQDCIRPIEGNVNRAGSAWRTIEAGIRASGSWPTAFYAFRRSPSLGDESLLRMVKLFAEHAYHLMPEERFYYGSPNWHAHAGNGLYTIGVLFPEFRESRRWRETAANRLYAELDSQVYPDGMQVELTSSYHQVTMGHLSAPLVLAERNGLVLPEGYLPKLERMHNANLYAAMPDGRLPALGDGGRTNVRRHLKEGAAIFPDRPDFAWIATEGAEGTRPLGNSYAFSHSGYLVMRSGWDPGDLYALLDVGPSGLWHQHEDRLSFVAYAYGRQHIVDSGSYSYDDSVWRKHLVSTFAHNTVIVDGEGQHIRGTKETDEDYILSEPLAHIWISETGFDYASGFYDEGYGPRNDRTVTHRRRMLFVKPVAGSAGYWIVSDLLIPSDETQHHYETLFHLDVAPDEVKMDPMSLRAVTRTSFGSTFAVWPVPMEGLAGEILAGQREPVLRGWQRGRGTAVPLPVVSYTFRATGTARSLYVLYPIPEGSVLPIDVVEATSARDAVAARVVFTNGRVHHIILPDQSGHVTESDEIETDGEAALVETDAAGKLTRTILAGGTRVSRR